LGIEDLDILDILRLEDWNLHEDNLLSLREHMSTQMSIIIGVSGESRGLSYFPDCAHFKSVGHPGPQSGRYKPRSAKYRVEIQGKWDHLEYSARHVGKAYLQDQLVFLLEISPHSVHSRDHVEVARVDRA
jgi:hypothetical protein